MFYTNRRPSVDGGKLWIHGATIGIAVSDDDGASWHYKGTVRGLDAPGDPPRNTHWAPEVIWADGLYHMYLTYITGVPSFSGPDVARTIVHFTSLDLVNWTRVGPLKLSSGRVIDAAVFACPDGRWRLWYKDDADGASTWSATSADLFTWQVEERVVPGAPDGNPHEGPNVFFLSGHYWLIVDEWHGQGVYRSADTRKWTRQGKIGDRPGRHDLDRRFVRHADVVAFDTHAAMYYFTHPLWDEIDQTAGPQSVEAKQTVLHHARLTVRDGLLEFTRDIAADTPLLRRA